MNRILIPSFLEVNMPNPPCLLHSDTECNLCYPKKPARVRQSRPTALPRRTLAGALKLSVEERVNIKVLAPILDKSELEKYAELVEEPLTEEELSYLIENRLDP